MEPRVDWNVPQPRSGAVGSWDRLVGPGATRWENWLIVSTSLAGAALAGWRAASSGMGWSDWRTWLIALFALDLAGGVVTNATSSAKRWYHRQGQGFVQHFGFTSLHLVHVALVAWALRGGDWTYFVGVSGYLLGAAAAILASPLYLRRPVSLLLYGIGVVGSYYLFSPTRGMEWFVPVFYLKLLVAHLVREEPYRPSEG